MTAGDGDDLAAPAGEGLTRWQRASGGRLSALGRLLPLLFLIAYLSLTVFLFAYGRWPWPVEDGTKAYTFLGLAHLALALGYLSAARESPQGYGGRWDPAFLFKLSLIVNLVLLLSTAVARTGRAIPDVAGGLADPGAAYAASRTWKLTSGLAEYARIALGPVLFLLQPLTVYYWQRLNAVSRVLAASAILGFLAIYVSTGTNKAIADLILVSPWLVLAGHWSGALRLRRSHKALVAAAGVICVAFFAFFFTAGQMTRPGRSAQSGYFPPARIYADKDNFLVRRLPPKARLAATSLTGYLTQGYYALYLALDKPFVPTFGVGHSLFLVRNLAKLAPASDLESRPYPMRIEEDGWDAYGRWSSVYTWIASDVSFPGTIVVVFLIGRLLALAWLDSLRGRNPFAVAALAQFLTMVYYFPANNQCVQEGEGLTSFYAVLAAWLLTRHRYVWRRPGRDGARDKEALLMNHTGEAAR